MATAAIVRPRDLTLIKDGWMPDPLADVVRAYTPRSDLGRLVKAACRYLPMELAQELLANVARTVVMESSLYGRITRADGRIEELGLLSRKVVTTAGVTYLCTYLSGAVTGANLKFHGLGTGTNAEASGDTALQTELTTAYNPDNTRATGTAVASTNTFTSVGTNTVDASAAVTEHGLFSAASSGTLWDRSQFSVVNLASADSFAITYIGTFSAGG